MREQGEGWAYEESEPCPEGHRTFLMEVEDADGVIYAAHCCDMTGILICFMRKVARGEYQNPALVMRRVLDAEFKMRFRKVWQESAAIDKRA